MISDGEIACQAFFLEISLKIPSFFAMVFPPRRRGDKKMNRRTFLQSTVTALGLSVLPRQAKASSPKQGLIMLGWDSAGEHHVRRLLSQGRLPNLASFLSETAGITPLMPTGASLTIPVWTEIFTGLNGRQTGALGNHPMAGKTVEWASMWDGQYGQLTHLGWFRSVPYEHTIQYAMQQEGFATAWLSAKPGYLGTDPESSPIACIAQNVQFCCTAKPKRLGDPYMLTFVEGAVNFSAQFPRSLTFIHLNPDKFGHLYGGESPEYESEIERCDNAFGVLLTNIDREKTGTMVISDHGFDGSERKHLNAPWSWMVTDMPVRRRWAVGGASTVDVYPTVLGYWGIPTRRGLPQLRSKPLNR